MKPRHLVLLFALPALAVVTGNDRMQSGPVHPSPAPGGTTFPAFSAGQILNLDPTGKVSPAQQAAEIQIQLGEAASQSSEGLVEEKSPVKNGGVMVNLQGRFQNAMTMSIDAAGNTIAPCLPAAEVPAKKVK
jgi:hypothetical protein